MYVCSNYTIPLPHPQAPCRASLCTRAEEGKPGFEANYTSYNFNVPGIILIGTCIMYLNSMQYNFHSYYCLCVLIRGSGGSGCTRYSGGDCGGCHGSGLDLYC